MVDWRNLSMNLCPGERTIKLKGDPILTKARVSLKSMMKSWTETYQGYLIERYSMEMEREISSAEWYGIGEVHSVSQAISTLLHQFEDVFQMPEELPPRREIEHHIHLRMGTNPVNVRLYSYAYHQNGEVVEEMLTLEIIWPSTSPYSSLVLFVHKKDGGVNYRTLNSVIILINSLYQ